MAELSDLRDKHVKILDSQLVDLIKKKLEHLNQTERVHHKQLDESQEKVEHLKSRLNSMKETLHSEITELGQKELELTKYKSKVDQLESQRNKLLEEIHTLTLKRNSLKSIKPSLNDEQILEDGNKKLKLYKELTGIKWDFWDLDTNIAGIVSNRTDYIKHFSYKKEETKELSDCLWQEILLATNKGKGIIENKNCKENIHTSQ